MNGSYMTLLHIKISHFLKLVVQEICILMPKSVPGRHTIWFKIFILELWLLQAVLLSIYIHLAFQTFLINNA